MSELKVYSQCYDGTDGLFYLKSEVDKVIAELKDDVTYWKKVAKKNMDDNVVMAKQRVEAFKREHHQKYKRCRAMAMWCRMHDEFTQLESERLGLPQRTLFLEYRRKAMWWNKWHKRLLELAEKFKEDK